MIKGVAIKDMYHYLLPVVSYRVKSDMRFETMCQLAPKALKLNGDDIFFCSGTVGSINVDGVSLYGGGFYGSAADLNEHFLKEGKHALTADDLKIPSGWSYPCGEIVDEGLFLFVLLEEDTALQQGKSS